MAEDVKHFVAEIDKLGAASAAGEETADAIDALMARAASVLSEGDRMMLANALYVKAEEYSEAAQDAEIREGDFRYARGQMIQPDSA